MIKYTSFIPLVGGMTFGHILATGQKPQNILSYRAFEKNDSYLRNYMPDVPYEFIDDENYTYTHRSTDFVSFVCPCAGLSVVNNRSSASNPTNDWMYKSAIFTLKNIRPRVAWGENAPVLFTLKGKEVRVKLYEIAKRFGYSLSFYKTNTILHGLPQKRQRTFYFFWQSKHAPIMPYYNREHDNLLTFLNNVNPELSHYNDNVVTHSIITQEQPAYKWLLKRFKLTHKEAINRWTNKTIAAIIQENNLYPELLKHLKQIEEPKKPIIKNKRGKRKRTYYEKWEDFYKIVLEGRGIYDSTPLLLKDTTPGVIARNTGRLTHPLEDRYLNLREMMALMGMPNDFNFDGDLKNVMTYLGQNVPTFTARDMTLGVVDFLNNKLKFSSNRYLMQDNTKMKIVK